MVKSINGVSIIFGRDCISSAFDKAVGLRVSGVIHTVNSNMLSMAYYDPFYKRILNDSLFNICDGSVLARIMSILNKMKLDSYPGPDFFMDTINKCQYRSAFVGGDSQINLALKDRLMKIDGNVKNMPFVDLPFCEDPRFFDYKKIASILNSYNSDIVWVSLGAPKQDYFSYYLLPYLTKGVVIPVGAAFNFHSGAINRAPLGWRKYGFEWLYRLFIEPQKTYKRLKSEFCTMPRIVIDELINR